MLDNLKIEALTDSEKSDTSAQTIEELRARMLKQLKDQQQENDSQIDLIFSQHKNLQKQQQQEYDEELNKMRQLIESQQEQHKNAVNALRSALQKEDQQNQKAPKEDHTLEYSEKLRTYQTEQNQKDSKRRKVLF